MDGDKLFAVLVLYNCDLKDSLTYKSILQNNNEIKLRGIIYDNSCIARDISGIEQLGDFSYQHNPGNPGLAFAYNFALQHAAKIGCEWLVLLDQDTFLTAGYFQDLAKNDFQDPEVAAFIPVVKYFANHKKTISPSNMYVGGFKPRKKYKAGKQKGKIFAINSGTVANINFLKEIKGFNTNYSLDMLDHWYFREIYQNNKLVSILNSEIYQDLSVMNFEQNMPLKRYLAFIKVENDFFKSGVPKQYFLYKIRLFFRILKQLRYNNKEYFKATIKQLSSF